MYLHVCTYACIYVSMSCIRMLAYMYICTYARIYIHMCLRREYIRMYGPVHRVYTYAECTHTRGYVMYAYMYIHTTDVCIHVYTCMHTSVVYTCEYTCIHQRVHRCMTLPRDLLYGFILVHFTYLFIHPTYLHYICVHT